MASVDYLSRTGWGRLIGVLFVWYENLKLVVCLYFSTISEFLNRKAPQSRKVDGALINCI